MIFFFKSTFSHIKNIKIFRYLIVGTIASIVDFSVLFTLVNFFSFHWFYSASLSFILATLVNYYLSITYVFSSGIKFKEREEFLLVFIMSIVGLTLNQLFIYILYKFVFLNLFYSKVITTGIVFFWNYSSRRYFIFR
jgi:putative flippase GtrA